MEELDAALKSRAYQLWEERGRPWASPEVDWFAAEQELRVAEDGAQQAPTILAARAVGSVLGSVAGIVSSLTEALRSE